MFLVVNAKFLAEIIESFDLGLFYPRVNHFKAITVDCLVSCYAGMLVVALQTSLPHCYAHGMFTLRKFRPRLHGNGSKWNRTSSERISLTFTRELMESFQTQLLAVPELFHLESRSHMEPNQKVLVYTPRTVLVRYA